MTDLRKAAEMALEALEHAVECVQTNYLPDKCGHDWDEQIEALRQALSQPEPTVEDNSQNWKGMDGAVAWHLIDRHADNWADIGKMMDEWLKANQAQPEQWKTCRHCGFQYRPPKEDKWHPLSQPEQEPVGYVTIETISSWAKVPSIKWFKKPTQGPLYTAPPKREWVGLTRRELDIATLGLEDLGDCYKAIEAKLKEKNT